MKRLADILHLGKQIDKRVAEAEIKIMRKVEETISATSTVREERLEAGMKNLETQMVKQISETTNTFKEVMKKQEQESKIDRSCNIILHNIPESDSAEPEVRKQHDVTKVDEISKAIIGDSHQCSVEQAFRLGKKTTGENDGRTGRPRLLLVKLGSREQADKLFKERFCLKGKGFPNIYITRDLPLDERERLRKLRAELLLKGKDTHKIMGDKVVPKN